MLYPMMSQNKKTELIFEQLILISIENNQNPQFSLSDKLNWTWLSSVPGKLPPKKYSDTFIKFVNN